MFVLLSCTTLLFLDNLIIICSLGYDFCTFGVVSNFNIYKKRKAGMGQIVGEPGSGKR